MGLVYLHLERIIRTGVNTEIFDLVHRDRLVLRCLWGGIAFGIRPESADLDFAGRHSAVGVNLQSAPAYVEPTHDYSEVGIVELLVGHLGVDIDSR